MIFGLVIWRGRSGLDPNEEIGPDGKPAFYYFLETLITSQKGYITVGELSRVEALIECGVKVTQEMIDFCEPHPDIKERLQEAFDKQNSH